MCIVTNDKALDIKEFNIFSIILSKPLDFKFHNILQMKDRNGNKLVI